VQNKITNTYNNIDRDKRQSCSFSQNYNIAADRTNCFTGIQWGK